MARIDLNKILDCVLPIGGTALAIYWFLTILGSDPGWTDWVRAVAAAVFLVVMSFAYAIAES